MMTAEEFGKKIKQKYPQYKDLSDYEVGKRMYDKYPEYQDKVANPNQGAFESGIEKTGLYDIPLVGGLLRAATHPALKYGETVAEGVGAFGDLVGNESFRKSLIEDPFGTLTGSESTRAKIKGVQAPRRFISESSAQKLGAEDYGTSFKEAAKIGAGGASYAIPGAGLVGGTTVKGLAGAGAASGFAESDANNLPQEIFDTALGATLSPILGKFAPEAAGKILGLGPRALDKLPKSMRKDLQDVERKVGALEQNKMATMVGYKNLQKAREWGITVDDMPEDVIYKVQPEMDRLGQELDDVLSQEGATTTLNEVKDAIIKAQRQTTPGLKDINLNEFSSRIDDFLRENISENAPEIVAMGPGAVENYPLPLSIVNKVKIRLGERYNEDPVYKQAYRNLQNMIEERSGQKEIVKGINEEYNILRDIKNNATKQLENPNKVVTDFDIKKSQIESAPLTDSKMGVAAATLAPAMMMAGPVGAVPGGIYMTYRILSHLLRDPKAAAKILGVLEKPGKAMETKPGQVVKKGSEISAKTLKKLLEQAGVRGSDDVINTIFGTGQ